MSEDEINRFIDRIKLDKEEFDSQLAQVAEKFPLVRFQYAL
ncbi:MAG: hypothetical protein ACFFDT_14910 [Candidatus Hodarchaeota archaeon]